MKMKRSHGMAREATPENYKKYQIRISRSTPNVYVYDRWL